MKKHIFKPLGLKNTMVYNRRFKPRKIKNLAHGYVLDKNKRKVLPDSIKALNEVYYFDAIIGDGNIHSTVNDLLRWDRSLYGEKLIPKTQMEFIFKPATLNGGKQSSYGLGWLVENIKDLGKTTYHSGSWHGYASYIEREVDLDKTIIYLQNSTKSPIPIKVIRNILNNVAEETIIKLPEATLKQYEGKYQLQPNFIITIKILNGQLRASADGQDPIDMYAVSQFRFIIKEIEAAVEFRKNDQNEIDKLILFQGGRESEAKKIKE